MLPLWCSPLDTVTTRGWPPDASRAGSSRPVSAKWPRWLVPNCISNPSAVSWRGIIITPALLTSRSSGPENWSANARTDARSARSSGAHSAPAPISRTAARPLSALRLATTTRAPWRATSCAVWYPMPLFPPVTTAVRPDRSGISSAVQRAISPSTSVYGTVSYTSPRDRPGRITLSQPVAQGGHMDIGIGLPNTLTVAGPVVVDWARRAEERGFSTVATIDRIVYPSYDSLTSLAVAAGATSRIGLFTDVLLTPLYQPALLAKVTASLAAMSGDRLTRAWAGENVTGDDFPVAPTPPGNRVPVLIGGNTDASVRRAVAYGDGWTAGGGGPAMAAPMVEKVRQAWQEAGREGEPRIATLTYFGLGDEKASKASLRRYYAFLGDWVDAIVDSAVRGPQAAKDIARDFAGIGVTELVFVPTIASLDEIDRLADAVF